VEVIAHILLPLIVAVSIVLMLARPHGIPEVWWISGGVLLLIALRLVPLKLAAQALKALTFTSSWPE
jgi:arsenical pump membrane protein